MRRLKYTDGGVISLADIFFGSFNELIFDLRPFSLIQTQRFGHKFLLPTAKFNVTDWRLDKIASER